MMLVQFQYQILPQEIPNSLSFLHIIPNNEQDLVLYPILKFYYELNVRIMSRFRVSFRQKKNDQACLSFFLLRLNPYSAVAKATSPKMIPGKLAVAKAKSLGFLPRP